MRNHFHLVVRTPEMTLAAGMQGLKSLHAQRFNRRHGLTGHLFQGRYHSVRPASDAQLLEELRYVALNPVRARLRTHALDWPWSGHRELVGKTAPGFVDVRAVWGMFDPSDAGAGPARYAAFVEDGIAMSTAAA